MTRTTWRRPWSRRVRCSESWSGPWATPWSRSPPHYRILVVLCANGPMRSGDLAERLGVHQSTLTRTADRLVAGEWVRRKTRRESRREVLVHPTRDWQNLVKRVMTQRRHEIEAVLDNTDERSRKAILRGFKAFALAAGEPEA